MKLLSVAVLLCACTVLVQSQKCSVQNCQRCNSSGKKCLTCEAGFKGTRDKKDCYKPTAAVNGPCNIQNCKQCNPKGNKCLTCNEGFTNNKKQTACFVPTAIIDPDYIEGNAIPGSGGNGGGDFDKEAYLLEIMEKVKALIKASEIKTEANAEEKARELDAAIDTETDVSAFLDKAAIQALIDAAKADILDDVDGKIEESAEAAGAGGGSALGPGKPGDFNFGSDLECMRDAEGTEYVGTISETWDGKQCLPWKDQVRHHTVQGQKTYYDKTAFPFDRDMSTVANHCRSTYSGRHRGGVHGPPWCYHSAWNPGGATQNSATQRVWGYCNIPLCGNSGYRDQWEEKMKQWKANNYVATMGWHTFGKK